ncbi:thiosulfate oxidation carrier complex protein SoxZ [Methylobrevis pamukkalensis]
MALCVIRPGPAAARIEGPTLEEEIAGFAGDAAVQRQGLALRVEALVEDGYNVPVEIALDGSLAGGVRLAQILLLAPDNPRVRTASFTFSAFTGVPRVETRVRLARSQTITALARLSDGRVLRADREVAVTVGGCDVHDEPRARAGSAPMTARVKVPARVRAGEAFEVRTLVSHPMESGFRRDAGGAVVPRRILHRFACSFEGEEVFACDLGPAMSANPFLEFSLQLARSGTLGFVWFDDDGSTITAEAMVTVT